MGPQIGRRVVFVQPTGLLQPLEKIRHRTGVVAGSLQCLQADTVGLTLEVPRVAELRLHDCRLRGHDRGLTHLRIAA